MKVVKLTYAGAVALRNQSGSPIKSGIKMFVSVT